MPSYPARRPAAGRSGTANPDSFLSAPHNGSDALATALVGMQDIPTAPTGLDAICDQITRERGRTPTEYQRNIFAWIVNGRGNLVVNAVSGSGKTSTLEDSIRFIPDTTPNGKDALVLMLAFNKEIATTLQARIPNRNVSARTIHSLCIYYCKRGLGEFELLTRNGEKSELIFHSIVNYDQCDTAGQSAWDVVTPFIGRLIGLMKNLGYGPLRPLPDLHGLFSLASKYGLDTPDPDDMNPVDFHRLICDIYTEGLKNIKVLDFDDCILYPLIYKEITLPKYYSYVFIDEAQDLCPVQIAILQKLKGYYTRFVFVGDRNQAIYSFRGADSAAMDTTKSLFHAAELPLSTCFRCAKSIVELAQTIVPQIEYHANAPDGTVATIQEDEFVETVEPGDFVLCRVTADLADYCFELIRAGIKAIIRGRDIGVGLMNLVKKIDKIRGYKGRDWEAKFDAYAARECKKYKAKKDADKLDALKDRLETVRVLSAGATTASEVVANIDKVFSDTNGKDAVIFSTIHRAKGLEARRVFILRPDLLPHPMARTEEARVQESNLKYVAITRAREELYWVEGCCRREKVVTGGDTDE